MGKSKAAPERVIAAERRVKALELRKLGFTYRRIGEQLGVTESAAHKMVTKSLQELNEKSAESAVEVRRLELERLDEWLLRVAQEMKNGRTLAAIDRGIRIQNRRARLLGLDAPTKIVTEEIDKKHLDEMRGALEAGDESALEYLERIASGENYGSVCEDWKRRATLASSSDTVKMTHEELVKAARGKMSFVELVEIRARPEEDQAEGQ